MATHSRSNALTRRRSGAAAKRVLLALLLVLLCLGLYLACYEPAYGGRLAQKPDHTLVFAHRGFGDLGPDNSLFSVEQAMFNAMDGVDVDGQLTKDSALVIFHDLSVDRLTSGTGKVRDKTKAEMLALDLGPKYDSTIHGANVHTFEDFVTSVNKRGILMVELKVPSTKPTGIEQLAVDGIKRNHAYESVILSSFNPFVLYRVKKLDPRVRTAFIFMDTNWNPELLAEIKPEDRVDLPWLVRQEWIRRVIRKIVKPDYLSINHEVDERVTNRLIRKGWPVFIWTIDDEADIKRALAKRPFGIISDQPLRAKRLRDG